MQSGKVFETRTFTGKEMMEKDHILNGEEFVTSASEIMSDVRMLGRQFHFKSAEGHWVGLNANMIEYVEVLGSEEDVYQEEAKRKRRR